MRKIPLLPMLVLTISLASCCQNPTVAEPIALPLPTPPRLPALNQSQRDNVPRETWVIIVERESLIRGWAQQLKAIIQSTHEAPAHD